jgi:hypothetical protein
MPRNVRQRCRARFTAKIFVLFVIALASLGCSHTVLVRTAPEGATVSVDGEEKGEAPVVVETRSGVFDTMSITAELEGFSSKRVLLEQTEWFLWPGLLAVTPFLALPLIVVFPPVGAIVAVVWALATSPTLLSLAFIRRYPDEVVIELEPRQADESLEFLPTDWWTIPEEYAPNPPPTSPQADPADPAEEVPEELPSGTQPQPDERDDASPSPG